MSFDREDASSVVTAGATANTTVKNSRASRESGRQRRTVAHLGNQGCCVHIHTGNLSHCDVANNRVLAKYDVPACVCHVAAFKYNGKCPPLPPASTGFFNVSETRNCPCTCRNRIGIRRATSNRQPGSCPLHEPIRNTKHNIKMSIPQCRYVNI